MMNTNEFAVSGIGILLIVLVIAAVLLIGALIAVLLYRAVYARNANRRLKEHSAGKPQKRTLAAPFQVLVTVLGVIAAVGVGIIVLTIGAFWLLRFNTNTGTGEELPARFDPISDADNSLVTGYQPEDEIAGYTRFVQESGDITFVYYVSRDWPGLFPQLLVHAAYTGETEYAHMEYETMLHADRETGSGGGYDAEGEQAFWFAGRFGTPPQGQLELHIYLMTEEGYRQEMTSQADPAEVAAVSETLSLDLAEVCAAMEAAPIPVTTETAG